LRRPIASSGAGKRTVAAALAPLPHKIATLLYAFNAAGETLLLERSKEPNRGLWSPAGGKLAAETGESPHACACREAREELGLDLAPADLRLTGLVSERGYEGQAHWLMFLFEISRPVLALPPPNREGRFGFFPLATVFNLNLPETDREKIWPLFLEHRGGFFAAHCHCRPDGSREWLVEESRPGAVGRRPEGR
jgi:8-oxo-dGTP diphosphatase